MSSCIADNCLTAASSVTQVEGRKFQFCDRHHQLCEKFIVAAQNSKFALKFPPNGFSPVPNFAFVDEDFLSVRELSDSAMGPCNDNTVL